MASDIHPSYAFHKYATVKHDTHLFLKRKIVQEQYLPPVIVIQIFLEKKNIFWLQFQLFSLKYISPHEGRLPLYISI